MAVISFIKMQLIENLINFISLLCTFAFHLKFKIAETIYYFYVCIYISLPTFRFSNEFTVGNLSNTTYKRIFK